MSLMIKDPGPGGMRLREAPLDLSFATTFNQRTPEAYERLLGPRTKLVAFTQVSNAIGTVTPALAQSASEMAVRMQQLEEQVRLTIEGIKERQEWELINNKKYGLLHSVDPTQRISPRYGSPTPDDLDELLALVWKKPSFFLAHPKAIAAFERECTRRGVPPVTTQLFGTPVINWRGVPLVPTDKLLVNGKTNPAVGEGGKTNILLLRVGEQKQGVIGLYQPGLPGEQTPGLSVRFMGINHNAVGSYLVSLYCSAAVLTDDAIAALENVEVGNYHEYKY